MYFSTCKTIVHSLIHIRAALHTSNECARMLIAKYFPAAAFTENIHSLCNIWTDPISDRCEYTNAFRYHMAPHLTSVWNSVNTTVSNADASRQTATTEAIIPRPDNPLHSSDVDSFQTHDGLHCGLRTKWLLLPQKEAFVVIYVLCSGVSHRYSQIGKIHCWKNLKALVVAVFDCWLSPRAHKSVSEAKHRVWAQLFCLWRSEKVKSGEQVLRGGGLWQLCNIRDVQVGNLAGAYEDVELQWVFTTTVFVWPRCIYVTVNQSQWEVTWDGGARSLYWHSQ